MLPITCSDANYKYEVRLRGGGIRYFKIFMVLVMMDIIFLVYGEFMKE